MSGGIGMGGNSNEKDKVVSRDVQRCSANFDNENLLWDEGGTGEELEVSAAVMRREKRHREREKAKERDKGKKDKDEKRERKHKVKSEKERLRNGMLFERQCLHSRYLIKNSAYLRLWIL
jgi:hypothetical protein